MVLILIIVSLYNLETIDIRDSGLKMLPPSIGCLQGLVHLLIGLNMTMTLPNEIGRLTNLQLHILYLGKLVGSAQKVNQPKGPRITSFMDAVTLMIRKWSSSMQNYTTLSILCSHGLESVYIIPGKY
jgi:hypothetical protein